MAFVPPVSRTMETTRALSSSVVTSRARMLILIAAFASFAFSVTLWFTGSRDEGLFVGLWVPSILALGGLMIPSERGA